MPILFRDFYTCEKCKKEFEWVKFELDRQDGRASSYYVQKIPNEPKAYVLNQDYSVTHWMTLTSAFTDLLTSL